MEKSEILKLHRLERIYQGNIALGMSDEQARRHAFLAVTFSYAVENARLREQLSGKEKETRELKQALDKVQQSIIGINY